MARRGEKNPPRLGYGFAKVEFIANFDEISNLIGQGLTMTDVYKLMIMKKKITMSIASFKNMCKPDMVKARNKRWRAKNEYRRRNVAGNPNQEGDR